MTPASAFRRLLKHFGPRGWWPVTPKGGRAPRYRPGRFVRPTEREAVEIAVGAILTQNTNWGNVERALGQLQDARVVTTEELLKMPVGRLARLIRSSGYFRQKAKKLKVLARAIAARGGLRRWLARPHGEVREELLSLWGVGPETADSILLYAGHAPVFVIDAYTLRIGKRVGWFRQADYARAQRILGEALADGPSTTRRYQEFHALLVKLAVEHCRTTPICEGCPLREGCRHAH